MNSNRSLPLLAFSVVYCLLLVFQLAESSCIPDCTGWTCDKASIRKVTGEYIVLNFFDSTECVSDHCYGNRLPSILACGRVIAILSDSPELADYLDRIERSSTPGSMKKDMEAAIVQIMIKVRSLQKNLRTERLIRTFLASGVVLSAVSSFWFSAAGGTIVSVCQDFLTSPTSDKPGEREHSWAQSVAAVWKQVGIHGGNPWEPFALFSLLKHGYSCVYVIYKKMTSRDQVIPVKRRKTLRRRVLGFFRFGKKISHNETGGGQERVEYAKANVLLFFCILQFIILSGTLAFLYFSSYSKWYTWTIGDLGDSIVNEVASAHNLLYTGNHH